MDGLKKKGEGFVRNKLNVNDFNINMFAHIFYVFWKNNLSQPESVKLEDITFKENSPGHIFLFSEEEMNELVENCSKKTKYLNYSRTGGYLILRPDKEQLKKALTNYYKDMNL